MSKLVNLLTLKNSVISWALKVNIVVTPNIYSGETAIKYQKLMTKSNFRYSRGVIIKIKYQVGALVIVFIVLKKASRYGVLNILIICY